MRYRRNGDVYAGGRPRSPRYRWECGCRDRFYYMAAGCVQAICPKCGTAHILDLRSPERGPEPLPVVGVDPGNGWG
jgi:hypothetical protein